MLFKKLRGKSIHLESSNHHFYIPVQLQGPKNTIPAKMLLDTGATRVTITPELARFLGLPTLSTDKVYTAAGTVTAQATSIPAIQIRGTKLTAHKVEAWIINVPTLLLGMNFLSYFRFRIDQGRKLTIHA